MFSSYKKKYLVVKNLIFQLISILGVKNPNVRWAKEFIGPYVTNELFTTRVRPIVKYGSVIWDPQYTVH